VTENGPEDSETPPEHAGSTREVRRPQRGSVATANGPPLGQQRMVRAGAYAWSFIGLFGVLVIGIYLLDLFRLVAVPLVIALFPAALLTPFSGRLKSWGWPPMVAALTVVTTFVVAVLGLLGALAWLIIGELEDLVATLEEAYQDIANWVDQRFGWELPSIDDLVDQVQDWAMGLDIGGTAPQVAFTTLETLSGILLGLIALLFYLKDGERIAEAALRVVPRRARGGFAEVFDRVWATLGGYFRGQIVVAAVDAVFIGLGLFVLGVPLAAPLALLVFFGGLFPIVGAFTAGAVAVLVALADGGLGLAIAVLILNVAVQQIEGNVLEPFIVGRAIRLHPLAILVALTAGAVTLGILGAFLAVPVAASVVRAIGYVLERDPEIDLQPP
jgi:predicted PurR-regulated permease PerM